MCSLRLIPAVTPSHALRRYFRVVTVASAGRGGREELSSLGLSRTRVLDLLNPSSRSFDFSESV